MFRLYRRKFCGRISRIIRISKSFANPADSLCVPIADLSDVVKVELLSLVIGHVSFANDQ